MAEESSAPVVVLHDGHRYVLTQSGVTRVVQVADYTPRRHSH